MRAQRREREASGVFALSAVGAVEIRIVNVCESRRLELGVFHRPTVAPIRCGLLLYNSYSVRSSRTLYDAGSPHAASSAACWNVETA